MTFQDDRCATKCRETLDYSLLFEFAGIVVILFFSIISAVMSVAMATANEDEVEDEELDTDEPDVMCPPGQHKWRQDECMVCTICGECTGFGVSCISKGQPDRNPGL